MTTITIGDKDLAGLIQQAQEQNYLIMCKGASQASEAILKGDNKMETKYGPTLIQRQIEMAVTNGRGYLENDEIRAESVQLVLKMLNEICREQLTPKYLEMVSRKKSEYW